ncbi:MAG TPA: hypothetical protein VIH21_05150 [Dehalococcoidia bacterium]
MSDGALTTTFCDDCGDALVVRDDETALRCTSCFDGYLREIDLEFLQSYAKLGVTARRTVAETCLRGLVLENPPARKILAMAIWEQFFLSSGDLIGLARSLRERDETPIVQSFLSFQLDRESAYAFFAQLNGDGDIDLLASLGLPAPEAVSTRCPTLNPQDARSLSGALDALLRDLRTTAERNSSALLLSELSGQVRGGPALTDRPSWLAEGAMRPDQVATLVLDQQRRQFVLRAVPVDEHQLGEVVDAIDCMTRASSNMIYAFLTVADEDAQATAVAER